jgi:xylulokinase
VIAGIDIGTQGLKAVIVTGQLRVLGEATVGYGVSFPRPGWVEQDPRLWERALGRAISAALGEAGAHPREIKALGVAGQLDGCVAIGEDGLPLAHCLIWADRRAELGPDTPSPERMRRIAGITPDPGHMAAKIRWLVDNVPACAAAARFHQPVSYIVSRLTGAHVFDHGLASTTMLYSLEKRDYDPELLAGFGVETGTLPAIADAAALAGPLNAGGAALTGLPQGTPVAVGTGDDFSSPLGAGLVMPGTVACVLGTAEVVGALDDQPKIDPAGLVETHGYPGGGFFIENPGWLCGGALTWFIETFRLADVHELNRLAAQAPPGADGLTFIPALNGAMAPQWIPSARGCFYGLTPAHGAGHMARAVLEGTAFAMRDVIEKLREMEILTHAITLLGGGAQSRLWARIRADVSGLPTLRPQRVDTSPLGAAMLAAVAAGILPDLKTCASLVREETERVEPDVDNRARYDDAYHAYRRLFESLKPMF